MLRASPLYHSNYWVGVVAGGKREHKSTHSSRRASHWTETADTADASSSASFSWRKKASCCSSAISASTRAATHASQASSSSSSSAVGAMDCFFFLGGVEVGRGGKKGCE